MVLDYGKTQWDAHIASLTRQLETEKALQEAKVQRVVKDAKLEMEAKISDNL